jgi:hypothetical protein
MLLSWAQRGCRSHPCSAKTSSTLPGLTFRLPPPDRGIMISWLLLAFRALTRMARSCATQPWRLRTPSSVTNFLCLSGSGPGRCFDRHCLVASFRGTRGKRVECRIGYRGALWFSSESKSPRRRSPPLPGRSRLTSLHGPWGGALRCLPIDSTSPFFSSCFLPQRSSGGPNARVRDPVPSPH